MTHVTFSRQNFKTGTGDVENDVTVLCPNDLINLRKTNMKKIGLLDDILKIVGQLYSLTVEGWRLTVKVIVYCCVSQDLLFDIIARILNMPKISEQVTHNVESSE